MRRTQKVKYALTRGLQQCDNVNSYKTRPSSDYSHVTAPCKLSFYYYFVNREERKRKYIINKRLNLVNKLKPITKAILDLPPFTTLFQETKWIYSTVPRGQQHRYPVLLLLK